MTTQGLNTAHQFAYNSSGEMTQVTTPLGGTLGWSYRTYAYSGPGWSYREVSSRTMSSGSGGMSNTWNMTTDTGTSQHASWTVSDTGANSSKVWTFGTSGTGARLPATYEERGPGGTALNRAEYTWTTDSVNNIYVGTVVNTLNPGSNQVQTKSTQTLDTYGNITQSAVYDFGNLSTPAKTYNFTYLTDANYTSRYIRNRMTQVTVTPAGGSAITLASNTYDTYSATCGGASGMVSRTGTWQHDDSNYGTSFTYRGNVTSRSSIGGSATMRYESTGVAICTVDGEGRSVSNAPSSSTGYSLPGVLTPGGNSNLATTVTYASSWQVTSVSGPNGAQGNTSYDSYGRPSSTSVPDGATTNYTYTYTGVGGATANTQKAQIGTGTGARWKKTTLDGFGRVTRVETGHDSTTVSQVDTQYAACACSPLGKLYRVSQPYAPGGTPIWTTYAYDGSGRTTSVTLPDSSVSTTEYLTVYGSYTGSLVRSTDAAGKWKIQHANGLGNLIRVIEPNPAGGSDLITNYTYNVLGQMTQVSMPRSNGTQTRTFSYSGTDLVSATNPENGTVTYQYDADHHVTKRTDAKGQETRYTYDSVGRLTQVQHWAGSPLAERANERVTYSYDSNPLSGTYSQYVAGRLAAVQFADENNGGSWSYMYSYNQAGRVVAQHATLRGQEFDATYAWDNEGRMTNIHYPDNGPVYNMQYDTMGRLGGMTQVNGTTETGFASASYGIAGELTSLQYAIGEFGSGSYMGEGRSYNSMFQVTGITVKNYQFPQSGPQEVKLLEDTYTYTTGANNGRITSATDGVISETVSYTYDALNRLASATASSWGQGFAYDGFGNLTTKSALSGSVPVLSVSFDPATNRQVGVSYDANGNPDGSTYDVENRMIQGNSMTYTYDHAGKRVMKQNGSTFDLYFYGIGGQKLETKTCTTGGGGTTCQSGSFNTYFGGKLVRAAGKSVAVDRVGSVRGTYYGSTAEVMRYYPYGEERTSTSDGREKFGTYTRDSSTQDYADQRYYNVGTGRFNVPDPYRASAGAGDSASWNRYGYVGGDPVNRVDPKGLLWILISREYTQVGVEELREADGGVIAEIPIFDWVDTYMWIPDSPGQTGAGNGFAAANPITLTDAERKKRRAALELVAALLAATSTSKDPVVPIAIKMTDMCTREDPLKNFQLQVTYSVIGSDGFQMYDGALNGWSITESFLNITGSLGDLNSQASTWSRNNNTITGGGTFADNLSAGFTGGGTANQEFMASGPGVSLALDILGFGFPPVSYQGVNFNTYSKGSVTVNGLTSNKPCSF